MTGASTDWLALINCAGQDQADNLTPPDKRAKWPRAKEAVVTAALRRCAACPVKAPCAAAAALEERDGANGGVYTYHGNRHDPQRWGLRNGRLTRLPSGEIDTP
jgi:hypothetical protein